MNEPSAPPMYTETSNDKKRKASSELCDGDNVVSKKGFDHINRINIFNEESARDYLSAYPNNWPRGLQDIYAKSQSKIPIRFIIVDDSGSMNCSDGHRLVHSGKSTRMVPCTRWVELSDSLRFHITLARIACSTVEFRFLNSSSPILIGKGPTFDEASEHQSLNAKLSDSPCGGTPLCRHIREVIARIQTMESTLRENGQKACVIIATDGESSDGDIAAAMLPLKNLPVWVVIRLCTSDEQVVNYWTKVDQDLELDMDVLDDLKSEAIEVRNYNPWLSYGEPLHRLREFGSLTRDWDLIDERAATLEEMRRICATIYGIEVDALPDPSVNLPEFVQSVSDFNQTQPMVFDVARGKSCPWVDCNALTSTYDTTTSSITGGLCSCM